MPEKHVILSCDGGGIRGLAGAIVLTELENRLQAAEPDRPLYTYFKRVAGTSTGAIIACGISSGSRAANIQNLYLQRGIDIFPEALATVPNLLARILDLNFTEPIYQEVYPNNRGINSVLQDALGKDNKFDSPNILEVPTLVTSYDTLNQYFLTFDSELPEFKTIKTWEVARASSAAPVVFPAYLLKNKEFITDLINKKKRNTFQENGEKCIPLVDGGLGANNPGMLAIAKSLSQGIDRSNIFLVSVGTGRNSSSDLATRFSSKQLTAADARGWGVFEWVSPKRDIPILRALFDASADVADEQAQWILDKNNYFRFQPKFSRNYQTFNANTAELQNMVNETNNYLQTPLINEQMNNLIKLLLAA